MKKNSSWRNEAIKRISRAEMREFLRKHPSTADFTDEEIGRVLNFAYGNAENWIAFIDTLIPEAIGTDRLLKLENPAERRSMGGSAASTSGNRGTLDFLSMSDEEFWRLQQKLRKDQ